MKEGGGVGEGGAGGRNLSLKAGMGDKVTWKGGAGRGRGGGDKEREEEKGRKRM